MSARIKANNILQYRHTHLLRLIYIYNCTTVCTHTHIQYNITMMAAASNPPSWRIRTPGGQADVNPA